MTRFAVIDVETANPDVASICQIGIAVYEQNKLVDTWETKVNPESYFGEIHIPIHGISERDVAKSPKKHEIITDLKKFLGNANVASYGHFDRSSINKAYPEKFQTNWLDICGVIRRFYDNLSKKGYGLSNVCNQFNIDLINHHNALSDALAAGEVLLKASHDNGIPIHDLFSGYSLKRPKVSVRSLLSPNESGDLFGEVLVFTGALSIQRSQAEELALNAGCDVRGGVTKNTTLLVVGVQDLIKTKGSPKSSKELKAEMLINNGQDIKILFEDDFFELIQESYTTDN